MVLHLPCARVPVRKYILKKKVLCSSDDFCFYVCFQCSLGKLCKGSDKLLDPGGEHSKIPRWCLLRGCLDLCYAHAEGSVNNWRCASTIEIKPFCAGKYGAKKYPYVVRHSGLSEK